MAYGQMYVLDDDGAAIACSEEEYPKWAAFLWSMGGTGRVDVVDTLRICTWFMGLDLRRDDEPRGMPLLWETAITMAVPAGRVPVWRERHPTAAVALSWHRHVVAVLRRQFSAIEDTWPS